MSTSCLPICIHISCLFSAGAGFIPFIFSFLSGCFRLFACLHILHKVISFICLVVVLYLFVCFAKIVAMKGPLIISGHMQRFS